MTPQKTACAIHDISCVGRCSLTVALPILSASGIETSVLPTAVLSTHTGGFTDFTYRDLTEDITPIKNHWRSLDLHFDAMYSGFLGSFAQIELVRNLFREFGGYIMVDPVMADNGELYSIYTPEMAQGMAELCSEADIILPNMTEAAFMLNEAYTPGPYTHSYVEQMLQKLQTLGAKSVVITGVYFTDDEIGAAALDKNGIHYAFSPKVDGYFHGTGDIFGSTLLGALLNDKPLPEALQIATSYVHECIRLSTLQNKQARYGVPFEKAIPYLLTKLY